MKLIISALVLFIFTSVQAQVHLEDPLPQQAAGINSVNKELPAAAATGKIKIDRTQRWKLSGNKFITGGLVFISGAAKGFNEALQYQYNGFETFFPKANDQWFYPAFSFRNKYKEG